jgi:probable HAF family extracellular repeat protein
MTRLAPIPGASFGAAQGISDRGQVVGYAGFSSGPSSNRAVSWRHGVATDLGTLGGPNSQAFGVNDGGQVVGWSDTAAGGEAFVWEHGTRRALVSLAGLGGQATAINNRGQIVGNSAPGLLGCPRPSGTGHRCCRRRVSWRENGGKPDRAAQPNQTADNRVSARQGWCGRDRIRTCVGEAGGFTGRPTASSRVPLRPRSAPVVGHDVRKRPADSFSRHRASPPVLLRPARLGVWRREGGGKIRPPSDQSLAPKRQRRGSRRWGWSTGPTGDHHTGSGVGPCRGMRLVH